MMRYKKSRQNAIKVSINVCFIGVEIFIPVEVITTGWMVLQSLTEKKVSGTLTNPIIPKTAEKFARRFSSTTPLNMR